MQTTNHTNLFTLVIFGMAVLGVAALIAVEEIRPGQDNAAIVSQILTLIVPTTAALLVLVSSGANREAINAARLDVASIHERINGRMDELLEQTKELAHAAGAKEEHDKTT